MRLFVATFRLVGEEPDIYLATTEKLAKELLIEQMRDHLYGKSYGEYEEIPDDYDDLVDIGWDLEYFYVDINNHKVHSDEHILKHVMETI
jgi:hypothetical protein